MELYSSLSVLAAVLGVFAFIFWGISKIVSHFATREENYRTALAALPKILALLNPPIIACLSCKRAIPTTPSFRIDGICPHCGAAHDPVSIAKAIKDS